MRIGLDIYSFDKLNQNYGVGPGVYVWHLLEKLSVIGQKHEFFVFTNRNNRDMVFHNDNVNIIIDKLPSYFRPNRIIHEQIFIPYQFKKLNLDFVHYFGNNISFSLAQKAILTVYDLMWKYYLDKGDKKLKYKYFSMTVPYSLKYSKVVITISKYIANEIKQLFRLNNNNIIPILLAPGKNMPISEKAVEYYSRKYNYQYIFTVTTSMPHKNLHTLLEAFCILKKRYNYDAKLIIAGQLKGNYHNNTIKFMKENLLEDDVLLRGFISEEEKSYLYKNANLFIYPSLYEGFGLPILEAMRNGIPVIGSNAASIPEVGGEACVYFDPNSVEDLVHKVLNLMSDRNKQKQLVDLGYKQVAKYSWEKVASETLELYEKYFK